MISHIALVAHRLSRHVFIMVVLVLPAAVLVASTPSLAGLNVLPSEIQSLEMGSNSEGLIGRIKDSGTYTREDFPHGRTFQFVWTPPQGSYYQTVTFRFTKKDRLYMIRFTLADPRRDAGKLKKAFFEEFGFPDEDPKRYTEKSTDTLLYGPDKSNNFLFELTDTKTGQKSFELFRRGIFGQDTMKPPKVESTSTAGSEPPPQEQPAVDAPRENAPQPEKRKDEEKSSEADKTAK